MLTYTKIKISLVYTINLISNGLNFWKIDGLIKVLNMCILWTLSLCRNFL